MKIESFLVGLYIIDKNVHHNYCVDNLFVKSIARRMKLYAKPFIVIACIMGK